jgi:hypothetical protein
MQPSTTKQLFLSFSPPFDFVIDSGLNGEALPIPYQGVEKQASGRQPRRVACWKAQHIHNM